MKTREQHIEWLKAKIQQVSEKRKICTHDLNKGGRLEILEDMFEDLLKEV